MAISEENTRITVTISKKDKTKLEEIADNWSGPQPGRPSRKFSLSEVASHFITQGINAELNQ